MESKIILKIAGRFFGKGLGNNIIIEKFAQLIIQIVKPIYVDIEGSKMIIDSMDNLYLGLLGSHEKFETNVVKKLVKSGDNVIDVGANQGYYTLLFSKLVGEKGNVTSFEPDPENCKRLRKNLENNQCKNVVLEQKAVSHKTGEVRMYMGKFRTGNRIYDSHDNRKSVIVKTASLDDYFKNSDKRVNFIKIDVEGAEMSVMEGLKKILARENNLILMLEFFPNLITKFGKSPREYFELLEEEKLAIYHMDDQYEKIEKIKKEDLLNRFTEEKENWTNLLCFKGNEEIIKRIENPDFLKYG